MLTTASNDEANLEGLYAGRQVMLLLSGPSLRQMDLSLLNRRGVITMAVNNAWAIHRPLLWTCVDPPDHFHDHGWKDPGILKFVPQGLQNKRLRVKEGSGFRHSQFLAREMPATFFYPRQDDFFDHRTFLDHPAICWGQKTGTSDSLGITGCRSVMLAAVHLLYYLGFRCIYLAGVDFKMREGGQNYAFAQKRLPSSVRGNNATYQALNRRFKALRPHFAERGLHIFNVTPGSGLTAFPKWDYADACERARNGVCDHFDTEGWYDPQHPKPPSPTQREKERNKYLQLQRETGGAYGSTNHGKPAYDLIEAMQPDSLLDLGCGDNALVQEFRLRGVERAIGVDFAHPDADVNCAIHELPFGDGEFDLICSFDALEHLLPGDVPLVLEQMARVGKRYIVSICCRKSTVRPDLHPTVRELEWWMDEFVKYGTVDQWKQQKNYAHLTGVFR